MAKAEFSNIHGVFYEIDYILGQKNRQQKARKYKFCTNQKVIMLETFFNVQRIRNV